MASGAPRRCATKPAAAMVRAALLVAAAVACSARGAAAAPQKLIVDTDMGFDVDDVVAVCLANTLHMNGEVELLAVVHDTGCELGVGGVSAMNHYYGHDNITVGAWKGKYGSDCNTHFNGAGGQNEYLSKIIDNPAMTGPVKSASGAMLATNAYRKVLAQQPNASVNIASIGMPTNLRDLLATKADQYSQMNGYDLIAAKVAKIVFMDGMYNFGCADGLIGPADDCYGSAQAALKMPPNVRLVFSGKGADPPIYSGKGMISNHPVNSPCRAALENWCCNPNGQDGAQSGRLSWDPITVMIASLDVGSVVEKEVNYGTRVSADADGHEHFWGNGTKNAQTDFTSPASAGMIPGAIDGRLDHPPPAQPPYAGWSKHGGDNCYGSRNGQPAHGARDLESPPSAAAGGPMTVAQCQLLCDELPGCTGVTVQRHDGGALFDCYRKADIDLSQCDHGTWFDTWTK